MAKTWRRPPLPKFTAKNLYEAFSDLNTKRPFTMKMALVIANMNQSSHRGIDRILNTVDKAIKGFGVEAIRSEKAWTNYYGDIAALYVNTGDAYSASVVYDVAKDKLYVTDYGEWVERNYRLFPNE